MTNRSERRHLAPTLPLFAPSSRFYCYFYHPFFPPHPTFTTLPSLPPSPPEGSLEAAPLNTEAGAQKHRVLLLRWIWPRLTVEEWRQDTRVCLPPEKGSRTILWHRWRSCQHRRTCVCVCEHLCVGKRRNKLIGTDKIHKLCKKIVLQAARATYPIMLRASTLTSFKINLEILLLSYAVNIRIGQSFLFFF